MNRFARAGATLVWLAGTGVAFAQAATPSPSPAPLLPTIPPSVNATATPLYGFVYKPQYAPGATPFPLPGAPEITEVDVNDQAIAAPGPLHVLVHTSLGVDEVVAAAYGYEMEIPKRAPGLFGLDAIIPIVPDVAKGKRFDVDVIATNKDGRSITITLPFMLK